MTPQEIFNAAYAKSRENTRGQDASEATELLGVVNRSVAAAFSVAPRVNVNFFAKRDVVSYDAGRGGWPIPADAEAVFYLERSGDLVEVIPVPFDDRQMEPDLPCVVVLGGVLEPAGVAGGPATNALVRVWYSRRAAASADRTTPIDAAFPLQFVELVILDVARYLARKRGNNDEWAALTAERKEWAQQFLRHLEHRVGNEHRRFSFVRRINSNALVTPEQFVTGEA